MKVDYTLMSGGLDLVSGSVGAQPGRVAEALNFEQVFGKVGYRRIDGYERFDGRPQPHLALYYVQEFNQGTAEIMVGDTLTGATAQAEVLGVELSSGSWAAGTAAGLAYVVLSAGDWVAGQDILRAGSAIAKASAATYQGRAQTSTTHASYLAQAAEKRRAVIQKVPGSGPIRGVAIHDEVVFAVRDAADGQSAALWKSTSSGWSSVRSGLLPGGRFEFVSANFSGDAKRKILMGCDGRNVPFVWDGSTYKEIVPIFSTQSTSATSLAIGTGSKAFTVVEAGRNYVAGDSVLIHSSANAANRMSGTVTSYTRPTLTVNVTGTVGSGTFTDWRIGLANFEDKPFMVAVHKDHAFLAYPRGQLQTSNIGDPLLYTSTAVLFGVGEEITGMASLKGAVLGVFCENRISLLEGSSKIDWAMGIHAQNIGTRRYTVAENAGNALFLGERGMVSMQAADTYGSFEPAICSRDVKPLLDSKMGMVTGSRLVRGKYQYRMYFSDGTLLSACILSPAAAIQPKDVSFMPATRPHIASALASGSIDDEDWLLFGTTDGWVMREDVGPSFDGAAIESALRLQFNHFKAPAQKKRFYKLTLELDSTDPVSILFRQMFDLSDGFYSDSVSQQAKSPGSGGRWDVSNWDSFYWSLPAASQIEANVDGVSKSMALVLWHESATDAPFTLQGLLTQFKTLGLSR